MSPLFRDLAAHKTRSEVLVVKLSRSCQQIQVVCQSRIYDLEFESCAGHPKAQAFLKLRNKLISIIF